MPYLSPKAACTSSSGGAGKLELVVLVFGLGVGREGTALAAICVGTYKLIVWNSVCLFNVFTASKFARRILVASASKLERWRGDLK
jgi:hypothetical protein